MIGTPLTETNTSQDANIENHLEDDHPQETTNTSENNTRIIDNEIQELHVTNDNDTQEPNNDNETQDPTSINPTSIALTFFETRTSKQYL